MRLTIIARAILITEIRTIGFETFLPCTTLFSVLRDMKYSNANKMTDFRLNYAKHLCLKSIFIFLIFSCSAGNEKTTIPPEEKQVEKVQTPTLALTGASRMDVYLAGLLDKKVAVVGNQTSMVDSVHLVDTLLQRGVNIVKVFSPEHGFRGDADAGEHVANVKDEKTGLPIVSLYGSNKKPTAAQLKGIDVVVFDIQDVGVRFYTYISTLHYVMEACAESGIPVIILDRPNPNGHYVDGPILNTEKYQSFVGMHPVPVVHGMTIGEYGMMVNGEGWLKNGVKCDLTVIGCDLYHHLMRWDLDIYPSPNLRSDLAISLYPSLCLLEATDVTVGRGTDGPFERYGHPDFPDSLTFSFTPHPDFGAKSPKHNGELCYGFNLNDPKFERMNRLDLSFLIHAYGLMDGDLFRGKSKQMFYLLCGTDEILKQLQQGKSEEEIRASWKVELSEFMVLREKYLIYP